MAMLCHLHLQQSILAHRLNSIEKSQAPFVINVGTGTKKFGIINTETMMICFSRQNVLDNSHFSHGMY